MKHPRIIMTKTMSEGLVFVILTILIGWILIAEYRSYRWKSVCMDQRHSIIYAINTMYKAAAELDKFEKEKLWYQETLSYTMDLRYEAIENREYLKKQVKLLEKMSARDAGRWMRNNIIYYDEEQMTNALKMEVAEDFPGNIPHDATRAEDE